MLIVVPRLVPVVVARIFQSEGTAQEREAAILTDIHDLSVFTG
jgi:hypothetical protein